jgi:hypothetical protein
MLSQQPASNFPATSSAGTPAKDEYTKLVDQVIDQTQKKLEKLTLGAHISYLILQGGGSESQSGSSLNDVWIFDPLTSMWQVPVRVQNS